MAEMSGGELRELLAGTWIGLALVVDLLVRGEMLSREDAVDLLTHAELLASDRRGTALKAIRTLIVTLADRVE